MLAPKKSPGIAIGGIGHIVILIIVSILNQSSRCEVSLSDDPALFPGHLQPLGTARPQHFVEVIDKFPDPEDFFKNYVNTPKPVIIKGGAKLSPAFELWTDEYLKNHPQSMNATFDIEMGKKEDRKGNMKQLPVKEFIEQYHTQDIYAVSTLPKPFLKEFLIPPPIRCKDVTDKLSMTLLWFSSGGTRSVLHYDSFDNINCLYRGSKTLLIVSYQKFKGKVNIDRPNGYSAVDVDKVNFTKYPDLREVEYHRAEMEEGDCLYIPYLWYHQVNSYSNKDSMNMAVNVWWAHQNKKFVPKDCSIPPEEATFDKVKFQDNEKEEEEGREPSPFQMMDRYNKGKNQESITLQEFLEDLKNHESLDGFHFYEIKHKNVFAKLARELFAAFDYDHDGILSQDDFNLQEHNSEEEEGEGEKEGEGEEVGEREEEQEGEKKGEGEEEREGQDANYQKMQISVLKVMRKVRRYFKIMDKKYKNKKETEKSSKPQKEDGENKLEQSAKPTEEDSAKEPEQSAKPTEEDDLKEEKPKSIKVEL